jgi:hypothetical protein
MTADIMAIHWAFSDGRRFMEMDGVLYETDGYIWVSRTHQWCYLKRQNFVARLWRRLTRVQP